MEGRIFQDVPVAQREQYLRDNSFKIDPKYSYTRELEEGELQELQNDLSQALIAIDREDQSLKEAKEAFNAVVKPLKEKIKGALQCIRTRSEEVTDQVYLIKDEHEQRVGIYSKEGVLLFDRSLLPDERQFSIIDNSDLRKIN